MPGIDANTVLCLHCDGTNGSTTFTDDSASAHTMTATTTGVVDTAQQKFGTASLKCTGANANGLRTPDSADFAFGSGDFTIDMWVRFNSIAANVNILVAQVSSSINDYAFELFYYQPNGNLYFRYTTGGVNASTIDINRAWSPSTGVWYHVAFVRSGSTGRLYVDGSKLGTDGTMSGSIWDSGQTLCIGHEDVAAGQFPLNGWLDEVRISKGIARWTANFTPPSAPYDTSSGGTVYTKAGYATAGGVGAGPSASITQETGFATAGGVGAGPSASVFVETGRATAGGVGAGPWQRDRTRTGYATAGGIGSGPSASVFVETGFATAGTVGSGASQKTAASGGTIYSKTGFATIGGVGSGPSESIFQESGYAVVGGVGSGASFRGSINQKSGYATIGLVGSGGSASVFTESGYAIISGVGSGGRVSPITSGKTGYGTLAGKGSGFKRMPGHDLILEPEPTDSMVLVPSLTGHF
jgi:hypothetical protein